jgi:hypothetical protein
MKPTRQQRRKTLELIARKPGGQGKLSALYLNALHGKPARVGLSQEELIDEILRLEFDEPERPESVAPTRN